jgi:tetratricopeptide (TPR) repeat protein
LKVVGWWRTGWAHIQRGDLVAGLRCCEEALALSPIPLDAAMVKAAQGYGLVKAGEAVAGTEKLADAVAWLNQSKIRFTWSWFAIWLGEAYLRQGQTLQARGILEEVLATSRELGYRELEGVAERLFGESLASEDPVAAASHLEAATQRLEEVGARNELGKAIAALAELRRAAGDLTGARRSLERALRIFEELGTLDEAPRVRTALASLQHPVSV